MNKLIKILSAITLLISSSYSFALPTCTTASFSGTWIFHTITQQRALTGSFYDANPPIGKLILYGTVPGSATPCDGITTNCKVALDGIWWSTKNIVNPATPVAQVPYWKFTSATGCAIKIYNFNIVNTADSPFFSAGTVETAVTDINLSTTAVNVNTTANTTTATKLNGLWDDNYFTTDTQNNHIGIGGWFGPYYNSFEAIRY